MFSFNFPLLLFQESTSVLYMFCSPKINGSYGEPLILGRELLKNTPMACSRLSGLFIRFLKLPNIGDKSFEIFISDSTLIETFHSAPAFTDYFDYFRISLLNISCGRQVHTDLINL